MRICFVGDSFVTGVGDDDCLGWPGRVCSAARKAGDDVICYNLGIRRDTSADIRARWRREAEARLPTEYDGRLVFSFGTNDCTAGDDADGVRVSRARALANAEAILAEARTWRPTLMVGPLPVGDDPDIDRRVAALSRDLDALCAPLGVPFLEVFATMAANRPWTREAAAGDGTHPNAGGYAALAQMVAGWDAWRSWFD
ncbi:MAG TPA: GDSL-type esterase/lipase family protein [Azospirillaceae bacterium]|nr:GDSL-type esterase/lipase family protein [Azospirillaceae bacterium]